jgi:hypothetical protein
MSRTVHVLLGSSAAGSFKQSNVASDPLDVLTLRDLLSCGPLPPIVDVPSWTAGRRAFWNSVAEYPDTGEEDLYDDPLGLQASDEIIVWLGTGLADQMALAWLPAFLRALDVQESTIKMVQFQHSARGVEISGLGMLRPKEIAAHPPVKALATADLADLDSAWQALTSAEPDELRAFLGVTSIRLPLFIRALRDGLSRYPDAASGLNAWEGRLLSNVRTRGPRCPMIIGETLADGYRAIDAATGGLDQVGDAWLFARMLRLGDPSLREPALEITGSRVEYHDTEVRLTPFGQRILDGKANFVDANGIDDWVFGVHLQSDAGRVWFHRDGELVRR